MMEELIGMITKHLKKGERVKIAGLGILQVRNRAARSQSGDRQTNPDQGQQKGSLPRHEGTQGGDLIAGLL
jgi:nucleoid DNA-binding protein